MTSLKILILLLSSFCMINGLSAQRTTGYDMEMKKLKKFYKKAQRRGLSRLLIKMDRREIEQIKALHDKYEIPREYMESSLAIAQQRKTTWRQLRENKEKTAFLTRELGAFLIQNRIIRYVPRKGTIIEGDRFRTTF